MTQRNREHLYSKFEQGAKPSEQDFRDLIDSTLNINDDHIKRETNELKVAAPLRVTTNPDDTKETLLKFYAGEENTWSINQKPGEDQVGFNISDAHGASRLFIESEDGNVGIGTTNPQGKLQIGSDSKGIKLRDDGGSGVEIESLGADLYLNYNQNNTSIGKDGFFKITAQKTVSITGNVGIGTTEPSAPLQVTATKTSNPTNNGLCIYNSSYEKDQHAILSVRVAGKKEETERKEGGNPFISWDVADEGGWSMGIDYKDKHKLKIAPNWANLTDKTLMTFDGQGRVGIGTTNPQSKLQIGPDSKGIKFRDDGGGVDMDSLGTDLHINYDAKYSTKIGKLELKEKPIQFKKYDTIGDDANQKTDYKTNDWICGIVGFHSGSSDIQEKDSGDIIKVYAYPNNDGYWHIRADFRSQGAGESWTIWLMAIRKNIAEQKGNL